MLEGIYIIASLYVIIILSVVLLSTSTSLDAFTLDVFTPISSTSDGVRGEVLMLTSELVVMALVDGTHTLLKVGKNTIVDPSVRVGDRIKVRVTPEHHVVSITKVTREVLP